MARTNSKTYLPGLRRFTTGRKINYMANELGIDESSLSQLIACKRGASLEMALHLAAYFHTSVETLAQTPAPESALVAA